MIRTILRIGYKLKNEGGKKMRKFRVLRADEIECRISQIKENGVQLLLYKTARTDSALLDEVYPDQWQCDFKALDGKMYGGIGIKIGDEWLWRWDCGSESNMEAEKGEASDAFKRAGFKWGIGTELYSSPFIWVPADRCKIEKGKCFDRFKVVNIGYDENEKIVELDIDNLSTHKSAFHLGNTSKADPSRIDLLRKQILDLAEAKGIDRATVTEAEYKGGRSWNDLNEADLAQVKIGLAKK